MSSESDEMMRAFMTFARRAGLSEVVKEFFGEPKTAAEPKTTAEDRVRSVTSDEYFAHVTGYHLGSLPPDIREALELLIKAGRPHGIIVDLHSTRRSPR